MGGKHPAPTGSLKPQKEEHIDLPKVYYLNRREGFLLMIQGSKTKKFKFPEDLRLYSDSVIGDISDSEVFIAGGTNSKGKFRKDCYLLNLSTMVTETIAPLPYPCKLGQVIPHKGYIYYICAITKFSHVEAPCPLMRYSRKECSWEAFLDQSAIKPSQVIFELYNIMQPGGFILNDRLYFFGGYAISDNSSNQVVASLDLNVEPLCLQIEPFEFTFGVVGALSASNGQNALIVGRKAQESTSTLFIEFTVKKGFNIMSDCKDINMFENYPPKAEKSCYLVMAFPKLMIKYFNSDAWISFSLSKSNLQTQVNSISSKPLTKPPLSKPPLSKTNSLSSSAKLGHLGKCTGPSSCFQSMSSFRSLESPGSPRSVLSHGLSTFKSNGTDELTYRLHTFRSNTSDEDSKEIDTLDLRFIVTTENDEDICLGHRSMLKAIAISYQNLTTKKLTAMDLNQISTQLNFKKSVSINDMFMILVEILQEKDYKFELLLGIMKIVHKVIEKRRISLFAVKAILKEFKVTKGQNVSKQNVIMVLTRIVKASATGIMA